MIHLLKRQGEARQDFPERADLPFFTDKEARAVLDLLRALIVLGHADVYTRPYTPEGHRPRWNVWTGGERVELQTWAGRMLCYSEVAQAVIQDSPWGGDAS